MGSCRSKERIITGDAVVDLSEDKLVDLIHVNDLPYESLYFRRLLVELDIPGQVRSFRANMYIKKDSAIIISVVPLMGIEVFRISLDERNITVIDRINRQVMKGDYRSLSQQYSVNLNFKIIQRILTNSLFGYPDTDLRQIKRYRASVGDNLYILQSADDRTASRSLQRGDDLTIHRLEIAPGKFRINRSIISQPSNQSVLRIEYADFNQVNDRHSFPNKISIFGTHGRESMSVKFNYAGFDINGSQSISFRIPGNYEVVNF